MQRISTKNTKCDFINKFYYILSLFRFNGEIIWIKYHIFKVSLTLLYFIFWTVYTTFRALFLLFNFHKYFYSFFKNCKRINNLEHFAFFYTQTFTIGTIFVICPFNKIKSLLYKQNIYHLLVYPLKSRSRSLTNT